MKHLTSILALAILLTVILACSNANKTQDSQLKSDNNSNGTRPESVKSNSNESTTATATPSKPTASGDIAGSYAVKGSGLDGKSYDGEVVVTKRDDVYQFSWKVGSSSYDGVGVQSGNNVAVAYSNGADGKGCGAVIYKINAENDSLEGKWGEWGVNQAGTETAKIIGKPEGDSRNFDVTGTNANGSAYKGKLSVKKDGDDIYQFSWDVGTKYIGTGVKMGDYLAAGSGSKQCGFVIYEVKDGNLEGKWGVPGANRLGTETASKK